jgi:hypothetical protein
MAGLDAAVFRSLPPAIEVAQQHRHHGPIASGDGKLIVTIPDRSDPDGERRR